MQATSITDPGASYVERVGRQFEREGLPRTSGRLFARLLLNPGEETLEDLAEELRVRRISRMRSMRDLIAHGAAVAAPEGAEARTRLERIAGFYTYLVETLESGLARFDDLAPDADTEGAR